MAKEWKSLWENHDGAEDSDKTKKSADSETPKKWYYSDGRNDDEEDEKDRTIIGFNTRYTTDDEKSDTDYGGYGYSGGYGYGYYDGFDDSDRDWYRRGSFRYSSRADYSPSSQFRTFSGRYTYTYTSADDEAKNKAIRALRNLTRSANTIVDKTGGSQQSFAVQFSNGTDSNGVSAELSEDKRRIVYVCPDELLATKTPEDEDATIDALTGFVLLRVQITQDAVPDTITKINGTGLHTVGFRAAECFFNSKDNLAEINAEKFSRETTDEYLAGLLAKGMLTRLSRRRVVANWGGFAPYFIRHAKKFAAVREHLEKAEMSVERIVGVMGYNMLADESQIELPAEINAIASKHLGSEVATENLLDACRALITELREFLTEKSEVAPAAGPIEKALADMMNQAKAAQEGASAGNKAVRDFVSDIAGAMGAAAETSKNALDMQNAVGSADADMLSDLKAATSLEQLLKQMAHTLKDFERADELIKSANSASGLSVAQHAKNTLEFTASSRPAALEALEKAGVPGAKELLQAVSKREPFSGPKSAEKVAQFHDMLKQLLEKAEEFAKKHKKTLKNTVLERTAAMTERLKKAEELTADTEKTINDLIAKLQTTPPDPAAVMPEEVLNGVHVLQNLNNMLQSFKHRVMHANTVVPKENSAAAGARALSTLQRAAQTATNVTSSAFGSAGHCFYDNYMLHSGETMTRLTREMAREVNARLPGTPIDDVVRAAVDNTMAAASVTDAGFMATFADSFMQAALQKLVGGDTESLKKAAEGFGITLETLNKLLRALQAMAAGGKTAPTATAMGKEMAELLMKLREEADPTDRHLFGEKIESKTNVLTGESIGHVNSEARNAAEEEYVAYLDHADCRPKVVTRNEDNYRGSYRRDNKLSVIQQVKAQNKSAIEQIRNALQFQGGKRTLETHGLRSGDLDEGSLHKLSYDCDNIWSQKTISKLPDVAVGILVDQSGSMSGPKISQAREICITLAEAIRKIAGVRLYVYGHTANVSGDDVTIYEHYTPTMGADLKQLGGIEAHSNNYDGYAIKDVAKRLAEDEAKKKYLFVIADGLPSGHGYGGSSAIKHVTSVCKFTRERLKIGTYAFAVGVRGHQQTSFRQQYGDKHVVFVDNVTKCLPQIVRFLRNALQQERKLVGVEN